jgi:hypothetical protein
MNNSSIFWEISTMIIERRCSALISALRQYHDTTCDAYGETLSEVISRVETASSLGKSNLGALALWKRIRWSPG